MIKQLIKLSNYLDLSAMKISTNNIDSIIKKLASTGGDKVIEELIQELVSDVYRSGGSLADMKETLTLLLYCHTNPNSLLPSNYEGLGDTDQEVVANYFTDIVIDMWKQIGKENEPTELDLGAPLAPPDLGESGDFEIPQEGIHMHGRTEQYSPTISPPLWTE